MDPVPERDDALAEIVEEIVEGRGRLHQLPDHLSADEQAEVRRRVLTRMKGVELERIGAYGLDAERAARAHCENFIGAAQLPMGVVGPISVQGEEVSPEEELYVPLATTEGALLASVNRGCRALREAGGAVVRVDRVGMTRAPAFRTSGIEQTRRLINWVRENEPRIKEFTEATSRFLELREIRPAAIGSSVFLRFRFLTGDAMGMNMVTIACDRVVREMIVPETGIPCVALSGNFCVDKKPASINFLEGRGLRIFAEVELHEDLLASSLKTDARALAEVQYRKNLVGSVAAGSSGFNAHFANVLAAFFIATGQDPAQVAEAAVGVTTVEAREDGSAYAAVYLPDVPLGVVGGGTPLGTQQEALALLGAVPIKERPGAGSVRLAEILGATVLAGELSLLAAFTSGDLAGAHERLGRAPGKPLAD